MPKKPIVWLDHGAAAAVTPPAPAKSPQTHKLAVRLEKHVNDTLRSLIRYRGDLSKMVLEALTARDLAQAPLIRANAEMVADTTISMPTALHQKLTKLAEQRRTSMNILVSSALAHWLAEKGLVDTR